MCGIAGCYQQADGHKLVEIMTDRIAHRGPDAAGIWDHDDDHCTAQFGHRRLSIIDLSTAADQPLSKHGMTLIYNGELYNYQELRAELVARGVRFTTKSAPMPIAFESLVATTSATIAVADSLASGRPEKA